MAFNLITGVIRWARAKFGYEVNNYPVAAPVVKGVAEVVVKNTAIEILQAAGSVDSLDKIPAFYQAMKTHIKNGWIANEALARGGWAQMRPENYRALEPQILEQFSGNADFPGLRAFMQDAINGRYGPVPSDNAAFLHRAQSYSNAMRAHYENARLNVAEENGHNEFKRVLGVTDHCRSDRRRLGCVEAAAMGWQSREKFIRIGGCVCGSQCHCTAESRKAKKTT